MCSDDAGVSLFSLLNGDDIHATFNELEENYPVIFFQKILKILILKNLI